MDHREHARLAAIIARRRSQLSRLEQQIIDVRRRLADDEEDLTRLQEEKRALQAQLATPMIAAQHQNSSMSCKDAGKRLRRCAGGSDEECRAAGKLLRECASGKKKKRK
jgi:hypothetical protein